MLLSGKLFKELAGILSMVNPKNSSLPYLNSVVITPENMGTSITATNLDIFAKIHIYDTTVENDSIIPITALQQMATKSAAKDEILIDNNSISIGNVTKKFKTKHTPDQFPSVTEGEVMELGTIQPDILFETMNEMSKFVSIDKAWK